MDSFLVGDKITIVLQGPKYATVPNVSGKRCVVRMDSDTYSCVIQAILRPRGGPGLRMLATILEVLN